MAYKTGEVAGPQNYRDMPTADLVVRGKQAEHMLKHARLAEVAALVAELTRRVGTSCEERIRTLEEEIDGWRRNYA